VLILRSVLLRIIKVSDKIVEKIITHISCSVTFVVVVVVFCLESRAVYEIMWKNIVELDRPLMTIWCTGIA